MKTLWGHGGIVHVTQFYFQLSQWLSCRSLPTFQATPVPTTPSLYLFQLALCQPKATTVWLTRTIRRKQAADRCVNQMVHLIIHLIFIVTSTMKTREYAQMATSKWSLFDEIISPSCVYLHRVSGDVERKYHLRYYKTAQCVHSTDTRGQCVKVWCYLPLLTWGSERSTLRLRPFGCWSQITPSDIFRLTCSFSIQFDQHEAGFATSLEGEGRDRTSFVIEDQSWHSE